MKILSWTLVISLLVLLLIASGCSKKSAGNNLPPTEAQAPEKVQINVSPETIAPQPEPEPVPASAPSPSLPADNSQTHVINLIDGGFEGNGTTLAIKAGDTVIWQNVREAVQFNKAMIIGTQKCSKIKSQIFSPGEIFKWTFTEPMTCLIVDGIYTTQTMKIVVE